MSNPESDAPKTRDMSGAEESVLGRMGETGGEGPGTSGLPGAEGGGGAQGAESFDRETMEQARGLFEEGEEEDVETEP